MSNVPNNGLPLVFMYNGKIFSKELDGTYHFFKADDERIKANSLGSISIDAATDLFKTSTFIGSIIVLTNNVNQKV